MTKFEEELRDKGVEIITQQPGCSMSRKVLINYADVVNLSEGWVSPEEHQDRVNELIEAKEKNIELLRKNSTLKSQLQQQALPVVPECVAKDVKRLSLSTLADWNAAVSYISKETLEWLSTTGNTNIFLGKSWTLCSLKINGYTVEKTQLFYLKHIDMSKADKECDWYLITDCVKLCHEWVGKSLKPEDDDFKFTQSEIDSMQTGSYEQIKVTE
jgi:hypothetical protein